MARIMKAYLTVSAFTPEQLDKDVNLALISENPIGDGLDWKLWGDPYAMQATPSENERFCQALVAYGEE